MFTTTSELLKKFVVRHVTGWDEQALRFLPPGMAVTGEKQFGRGGALGLSLSLSLSLNS
jgi:hypothetical protein